MISRALQMGVVGTFLVSLLIAVLTLRWLLARRPHLPPNTLLRVGFVGLSISIPVLLFERWGLGLIPSSLGNSVPLYLTLGLWGPLGESTKLAALWSAFSRRELRGPLEAVTASALVSSLFAVSQVVLQILGQATPNWIFLVAQVLSIPMQILISSPWAFLLGRSYLRSNPRSGFLSAWLAAVILHGVLAYLLALNQPVGLLGVGILLAGLLLLAHLAQDSLKPGDIRLILRRSPKVTPLVDLREFLIRKDTAVSFRWVFLGTLVNQGVLLSSLVIAVLFGNYLGVNFAAVDASSNPSLSPVIFLVIAALLAFPIAGFLIVRASGVPTLLEPALASVLALIGLAAIMGVAAPLVLAIVIACTPVALALSCAGAWLAIR